MSQSDISLVEFMEALKRLPAQIEQLQETLDTLSGDANGLTKEVYIHPDLVELGYGTNEAYRILRVYGVNTFGRNRISRANLNKFMNGEFE